MDIYRLELVGHCPSKKNLLRPSASGGMFYDKKVKAQIDALIVQAKMKWKLPPMKHPDIDVEFHFVNALGDRDNRLTTVIDVLVKARVLVNDNTNQFNGTVTILPAIVGNREGVVIDIAPKQEMLQL